MQPPVPAWKKLGLKLKYANEKPESIAEPKRNGNVSTDQDLEAAVSSTEKLNRDSPPKKKRKVSSGSEARLPVDSEHHAPSEGQPTTKNGNVKRLKKRVSFAADAEPAPEASIISNAQSDDQDEDGTTTKPKKEKQKRAKSRSKLQQAGDARTNPALKYLDQFNTAHASWKFNKNKETWLLKHIFSEHDIPGTYNLALAKYIHGLKGAGARERLKAQCLELLKQGVDSDKGEGSKDGQHQLRDGHFLNLLKRDLENGPDATKPPSERQEDMNDYPRWIQQQSRPRLLLWSLGLDAEDLLNNSSISELHKPPQTKGDQVLNGNKEAEPKTKKKKNRTVVVEYSSSSSSSSDSDTDSDTDTEVGEPNLPKAEETTSSSGSDDSDSGDESSTDSDS